jgi:putative transposase
LYRSNFRPSEQLDHPHVIAGVNVIASDSEDDAQSQFNTTRRARLRRFLLKPNVDVPDAEVDRILASPQGAQIAAMMKHTAVGTRAAVRDQLLEFTAYADADELMVCHQSPTVEGRLRSIELTAEAMDLVGV